MKKLNIDIETRSSVNLKTEGVYKYIEAPDFEILLFGFSIDNDPAQVIDLKNGGKLPQEVLSALADETVEKHAFNAAFERLCIDRHFKLKTALKGWFCSSVLASEYGLPGSLKLCASALKLDTQKMREGEALVRKFSIPMPDVLTVFAGPDWELYKQYCVQDVEVERQVAAALKYLPDLPMFERSSYLLDQVINDTGVAVDLAFAKTCVDMNHTNKLQLETEAWAFTGIENPSSDVQVKKWLTDRLGHKVKSLNKADISDIDCADDPEAARLLEIRSEVRRSSTTKYATMQKVCCNDGRLRGMFRFYGANRTGRWSGKFVQLHNMPAIEFPLLTVARKGVAAGDLELIRMTQDSVAETLSALIRTALVAAKGKLLVCADYSSIEARILSWLAGETWRMEVFAGHGKIYEASASAMFGVPIEQVTKGSGYRKKGKIAELACGYGGGVQALLNFGADKMGIPLEDMPGIISAWRTVNPKIVSLWKRVGNAALAAVRTGNIQEVGPYQIRFMIREAQGRKWLFIRLPSGRCLAYFDPVLMPGKYGEELSYMKYGNDEGKVSSSGDSYGGIRVRTYGAKLVENIVQAIARDVLAVGLWKVSHAGHAVVMHIHDEIVSEVPAEKAEAALHEMCNLMGQDISWANGLLLKAEGFTTPFYRKEP